MAVFDPLHSGHISYLQQAKKFGDKLIVLLNSDEWLVKRGKYFLPFHERKIILENLSTVDLVYSFEDDSLGSCIQGLNLVKKKHPNHEVIFCNGETEQKEIFRKWKLKTLLLNLK